jgi:hypothetical protein
MNQLIFEIGGNMGNLGVELAQIMMVPPYNMRVKSGFNKIILVKLWSNIDEIWSKSRV